MLKTGKYHFHYMHCLVISHYAIQMGIYTDQFVNIIPQRNLMNLT